jgi:hypothetical protein
MAQNHQNGPTLLKWPNMAKIATTTKNKIAQNGPELPTLLKIFHNGPKWPRIAKIAQHGAKWLKLLNMAKIPLP